MHEEPATTRNGPLTFTEPIDDDEAEPPEDYRTGGKIIPFRWPLYLMYLDLTMLHSNLVSGYHPMRIGDVIARRYKIERKLGWGVYSTVWLAQDNTGLNPYVAHACLSALFAPTYIKSND